MRKIKNIKIYSDDRYYCAFPSIVCRPDGELLVAFRRAPERRKLGQSAGHCDPNSQLVFVRSRDGGETWTTTPDLIYAHPMGGSQDPCMLQCRDGTLLCASYLWVLMPGFKPLPPDAAPGLQPPWKYDFAGGYLMRSTDGGQFWQGPVIPPRPPCEERVTPWGDPLPPYNRGAMLEGSDGLLYWAVACRDVKNSRDDTKVTNVHLLVSGDKGDTWEYRCPIAADDNITFNETSLIETAGGDIVAFMRTGGFDDHAVIARSRDRGRSFESWQDTGFQGHPLQATRLPDGRVLLVYGYRHEPFGVRARVLAPDCSDIATASEIILRDDGGSKDLGYPWSTVLPDGRVLVIYYFNHGVETTRYIGGSLLQP